MGREDWKVALKMTEIVIETRFPVERIPEEMPPDDALIAIGRRLVRRAMEARDSSTQIACRRCGTPGPWGDEPYPGLCGDCAHRAYLAKGGR